MKNFGKTSLMAMAMLLVMGIHHAQAQMEIPKTEQNFDFAIGMGESGTYSLALSWNRTHGLFESKKFRLGYGLRFSSFGGSDLTYITAPADLTANDNTIDTLFVSSPLTMGISALANIQYQFSPRFKAGFNIDVIGLGFGAESQTTFTAVENTGQFPTSVNASPTGFNLLLGGDNDIGQIKSEFYVAYALSEKFWLRGGMDMTFSEYTTERTLTNDNDRFRYKAMLMFVAISYNPFQN